jgi:hypothetical protein
MPTRKAQRLIGSDLSLNKQSLKLVVSIDAERLMKDLQTLAGKEAEDAGDLYYRETQTPASSGVDIR